MSKPIHLGSQQAVIVDRLVAAGRYASAEDAVIEGLRLLDARENRMSELRDAWHDGVASGDYQPLDGALDDLTDHLAARADTAP